MITIIAAVAKNNVIGKEGKLPWHMSADFRHFKEATKGHTVVMGRKTFESMGKPLPDRKNVVLAGNDFSAGGCVIVRSVEECLKLAEDEDIYIIGGASLYEQFLPFADRLGLN